MAYRPSGTLLSNQAQIRDSKWFLRQRGQKIAVFVLGRLWQKRQDAKQPYRFHRKDLEPFAFAGVWEFTRLGGEDTLSAAIIVGEANPLVGRVHDRMPVMLMSEDYDSWLDPATDIHDLKAMLKPYNPTLMQAYAVSRAVNSVKNDTEECIEPVAD
jgi:putative SOS response-associated peptidase YedK